MSSALFRYPNLSALNTPDGMAHVTQVWRSLATQYPEQTLCLVSMATGSGKTVRANSFLTPAELAYLRIDTLFLGPLVFEEDLKRRVKQALERPYINHLVVLNEDNRALAVFALDERGYAF